jgi:hypothetical protein
MSHFALVKKSHYDCEAWVRLVSQDNEMITCSNGAWLQDGHLYPPSDKTAPHLGGAQAQIVHHSALWP